MLPASTRQHHAFVGNHAHGPEAPPRPASVSPPIGSSMERSAPEYSQSGLPSPHPSSFGDTQSEASSVDHESAAPFVTQQEARSTNYSTSATPTSDYSVYPPSARSGSFPEHITRAYHPASNHSGSSGGMAQTPTSPSVPMQDGPSHQNSQQVKSDSDVPIDPSIAATSPTYAQHGQYSPYAPPPQDMAHSYQHPSSAGLYAQPRPDWTGYQQQPGAPITPGHHVFPQTPTSATSQTRPNQVYSFVPIPGAQQHKRPRRRFEEIERMYKCGWNGCEKAYGTLNHLNAHVTMQAHGQKRTPEEFKEIRKEWKARKKEEEAARKAEEERQRQAAVTVAAQNGGADPQNGPDGAQPPTTYSGPRAVQLPPIGYQTATYPAPPSAGMAEYGGSHVYPNYTPPSPYGQPGQQMYNQHNGGQPSH
ncbi:hypothetical protein B0T26DRAFT_740072 [Lasiosphaeria miniovina]|uniref:C2H2-type domain-containing protein n=1 Tax=Lasiosphaeria miniovina TaxID=1954250 RepID=A0AA40E2Y0_9PEZI|nr:uncharacterized protein B0T26DRAFT_740072 [Lasiosphaeria miniovina]KAK0723022.1 hypothetical protein B0T26DRAFT_740072 [Lasiosphaeria miniovina]